MNIRIPKAPHLTVAGKGWTQRQLATYLAEIEVALADVDAHIELLVWRRYASGSAVPLSEREFRRHLEALDRLGSELRISRAYGHLVHRPPRLLADGEAGQPSSDTSRPSAGPGASVEDHEHAD